MDTAISTRAQKYFKEFEQEADLKSQEEMKRKR